MSAEDWIITFPHMSVAEANQYASSLAATVRDAAEGVTVERRKERADTQDAGTTLAIILGSASVTALAKSVGGWLARNSGARIEIRRDGRVVASNLDSKDAARIAEAFARAH